MDIAVGLTNPESYVNQWWHQMGTDAKVNAGIVADHLEGALPDDLHDFRRVVREHSGVAPVNVTQASGQTQPALLYCLAEDGEDPATWKYNHYFLGYAPANADVVSSSRFGGKLGPTFEGFYAKFHNGLAVDIELDGGQIPAVESILTWADSIGDTTPDDLKLSLVGEEPYVPDPKQMAVVYDGNAFAAFVVLDRPGDNWRYTSGSFFYYPAMSRSGRTITPMSLIEREMLSTYLDYEMPMPYE